MNAFKYSSVALVLLALLCTTNGDSSQSPTANDSKKEESGQGSASFSSSAATATAASSSAKAGDEVAKDSSNSKCKGLRGVLHLCGSSSGVEEPSKNVEKRGLARVTIRESSEESDERSDSQENSNEKSKEIVVLVHQKGNIDVRSKPLSTIAKRQVDPRVDVHEGGWYHKKDSESSEESYERHT